MIKVSARAAQSPWSGFRCCNSLQRSSRNRSAAARTSGAANRVGLPPQSPKPIVNPPLTIMCDAHRLPAGGQGNDGLGHHAQERRP